MSDDDTNVGSDAPAASEGGEQQAAAPAEAGAADAAE